MKQPISDPFLIALILFVVIVYCLYDYWPKIKELLRRDDHNEHARRFQQKFVSILHQIEDAKDDDDLAYAEMEIIENCDYYINILSMKKVEGARDKMYKAFHNKQKVFRYMNRGRVVSIAN